MRRGRAGFLESNGASTAMSAYRVAFVREASELRSEALRGHVAYAPDLRRTCVDDGSALQPRKAEVRKLQAS